MTIPNADKRNTQDISQSENSVSVMPNQEEGQIVSTMDVTLTDEWLSKCGDDELLDIIVRVSEELKKRKTQSASTQQITKENIPTEFQDITDIPLKKYNPVPAKCKKLRMSDINAWYVLLISADPNHSPLALKVIGDVVIGRRTEGTIPDLDLSEFEPEKYGISRTHALLRPLTDQLIVSDLGSTNGTEINGDRLFLGKAKSLTDQEVLTLGRLHFQVRIMQKPGKPKDGM